MSGTTGDDAEPLSREVIVQRPQVMVEPDASPSIRLRTTPTSAPAWSPGP